MEHEVRLLGRERLSVTGVLEVAAFDEGAVLLHTELGALQVYGQGLKLKTLRPEDGALVVTGQVEALVYGSPGRRRRK